MLELAFQFQQKSRPIQYVSSLAGILQEVPATQSIKSGYTLTPYSPTLYAEFLNYLTPNNVLITIVSKGLDHNLSTDWYETPYSSKKLNPLSLTSNNTYASKLHLPERNSFIPDDAVILKDTTMKAPTKIISDAGFAAWYAFDNEFSDPSASFFINIRSPKANDTPKHALYTELLTKIVQDELNEFSYPATLAGLDFSVYSHIRGISIKVSGYPSKQSILLSRILNTLTHTPINSSRFRQIKDDLRRSLENSAKRKPYEQTAGKLRELLIEPLWSEEEKLAEIQSINGEELGTFRKELLAEVDVVTLTHGNTTYASALTLNQLAHTYLVKDSMHTSVSRGDVLILKEGTHYLHELNFNHPDTGYALLIQGPSKAFEERAFYSLLGQMVSSPYYNDIRTEKQLGYIVFATPFSMFEVPGIAFIVQSPVASFQFLTKSTMIFLQTFVTNELKAMTNKSFTEHKLALINLINEKDKKLTDRSSRFWREIDEENYNFDTNQKLVDAISNLSQEDVLRKTQEILINGPYLLAVKQGDSDKIEDALNESANSEFDSYSYQTIDSKKTLQRLNQ
jgi:secreted Zn-dependent insulinase-like peptidase